MSNLERVVYINHAIKTKGFVTRKEVSDRFEVHIDTIKRDIEYMRDFLSAPIKYRQSVGGYVYETPFDMLFDSLEDAVLYYIFVKRISESLKLDGLPYVPVISDEILKNISGYIPPDFDEIMDHISYDSSDIDLMDMKDFRNILGSFMTKRCVSIRYLNADGEESERVIEPLKLMNYLGKWYVIAFCRKKNALRVFLLSRFLSSELSSEKFEYPVTKRELDGYIDGSFGMFKSVHSSLAVIRVFEPAYYYVRNQKWHKDQQVNDCVIDGKKCLEITLPVGDRDKEILARVLSYSPDSEIVSPPALREKWLERIRTLYKKFCKK
ncbi:WYL domain-containing protein [bacterium]|nr:WYL domain-containing protein [bacterium]